MMPTSWCIIEKHDGNPELDRIVVQVKSLELAKQIVRTLATMGQVMIMKTNNCPDLVKEWNKTQAS